MKICIIGPVYTKFCFGGVATFVEGLADGFKLDGHETYIITDYTERKSTIYGTDIIGTFKKPSRKDIRMPFRIYEKVLEINPDIIITSLEYGLVNKILNKKNKDKSIKTMHYLHAFPSVKRSKINNFFVEKITKSISKSSKYVISNSTLTSVINSEIFNINSNEIINIGVGYDFLQRLNQADNNPFQPEFKNILFAGRLVKEKNVDLIIKAFKDLNRDDVILNIVGDGNEKNNLIEISKGLENRVVFHGSIPPKKIPEYFKGADVFISLNPHEPYGIVYLEALCSSTSIVCPKTGGQMDTLINYKDRVKLINPYDVKDITSKLDEALDLEFEEFSDEYIEDTFTYRSVAKNILNFIEK